MSTHETTPRHGKSSSSPPVYTQQAEENEQQLITLTPKQDSRREMHISVIHESIKNFMHIGYHLACLRDERLYLNTHSTFAAFVQDEFDFSVRHAERLIRAFDVVKELSSNCEILPESESQVRLLTSLPDPTVRREVWEQTIKETVDKGKRVTAKAIEAISKKVVDRKVDNSRPTGRDKNSSPVGSLESDGGPKPSRAIREESRITSSSSTAQSHLAAEECEQSPRQLQLALLARADSIVRYTIPELVQTAKEIDEFLTEHGSPGVDIEGMLRHQEQMTLIFTNARTAISLPNKEVLK